MKSKSKKVTIEHLARIVQTGFLETAKKGDLDIVRGDLNFVKSDLDTIKKEMKAGFKAVDERFDRIEKLILADHKRRIEKLEEEVRDLKNLLAVR